MPSTRLSGGPGRGAGPDVTTGTGRARGGGGDGRQLSVSVLRAGLLPVADHLVDEMELRRGVLAGVAEAAVKDALTASAGSDADVGRPAGAADDALAVELEVCLSPAPCCCWGSCDLSIGARMLPDRLSCADARARVACGGRALCRRGSWERRCRMRRRRGRRSAAWGGVTAAKPGGCRCVPLAAVARLGTCCVLLLPAYLYASAAAHVWCAILVCAGARKQARRGRVDAGPLPGERGGGGAADRCGAQAGATLSIFLRWSWAVGKARACIYMRRRREALPCR